MKKIGLILAFFSLVLTGCQDKNGFSAAELERQITVFESGSEQFSYEAEFVMEITTDDFNDTIRETSSGKFNHDLSYTEEVIDGETIVSIQNGRDTQIITLDKRDIIEGIQYYSETKITEYEEEIPEPIGVIRINPSKIKLTKIENNVYTISGFLEDFIGEDILEELVQLYESRNIDSDGLKGTKIIVTITFEDDSMTINYDMTLEIEDIVIDFTMSVKTAYTSFEEIDVTDKSKYQIAISTDNIPIDIKDPISYYYHNNGAIGYQAYLEPGKYTYVSNDMNAEQPVHLEILSNGSDRRPLYVWDSEGYNTDAFDRFFEVKETGYYQIIIEYPKRNFLYSTQIIKLDYESDGLDDISYVVTTSGEIDYQIEHAYDFISIEVPGTEEVFVRINHDENIRILADIRTIPTQSIGWTSSYVVLDEARVFYIYSKYGANEGTLDIEVLPMAQASSIDDINIKTLSDVFSDPVNTSLKQFIKIEIDTLKTVRFEFDEILLEENRITYQIKSSSGSPMSLFNHTITFIPGQYYFESTNTTLMIYRVRMTEIPQDVTIIETVLASFPQLYGDLSEEHFKRGKYLRGTQWIMYHFELTQTTDVAFMDDYNQWLLNEEYERINIYGLRDMMTYRLNPGHYYAITFLPSGIDEMYLPYDYLMRIYTFTGGKNDDSVYNNFETIQLPIFYKTFNQNYINDYDGFKFILTERTDVTLSNNTSDAILLKNGALYKRNISIKTYTLEPGEYTFMCNFNKPTWEATAYKIS
ncbi:hypothetical protein [Paracholeplasma manati]|uniref:hypothetical protein n=1 Tax=Paracholeplasma manati TaxID=591373 RepID=UPI002407A246|nr:hypothetical protein [Paracholeplasma manati]MDG0888332.1 hypothetical protein [Paracholeplasma manati]